MRTLSPSRRDALDGIVLAVSASTKRGPYKPLGLARALAPKKELRGGRHTGRWKARIIGTDGREHQLGVYGRKQPAKDAANREVEQLNRNLGFADDLTFDQWHSAWPPLVGVAERTRRTNQHRIDKYILPHLPSAITLRQIRRPVIRAVIDALVVGGLSKTTIDNALASFSAVLRYALERDLIDFNPAYGMRVDPNDHRLRYKKTPRRRRWIPPEEAGTFLAHVPPRWRAACVAPAATSFRPAELFAATGEDLFLDDELIYVWRRGDHRGGRPGQRYIARDGDVIMPGLKTTKGAHLLPREELGRFTLFPRSLAKLFGDARAAAERENRRHLRVTSDEPSPPRGLLVPSPKGVVLSQANFGRRVWRPAQLAAGTDFTLYDLRHTFTSTLSAAGIPDAEISLYSGHQVYGERSVENTMSRVYKHATGQWLAPSLAAVSDYLEAVLAAEAGCRDALARGERVGTWKALALAKSGT
jgi:integrase